MGFQRQMAETEIPNHPGNGPNIQLDFAPLR